MICPFCHKDSQTKTLETQDLTTYKRRGRFCYPCGKTYETVEKVTGNSWLKSSEYSNYKRQPDLFKQEEPNND